MLLLPPAALEAHHEQLLNLFAAETEKDIKNAVSIIHASGTLVILMTENTDLTIDNIPSFVAALCKMVALDIIALSVAQVIPTLQDDNTIFVMTDDGRYTLIAMYDIKQASCELSSPHHLTMSNSIDPELNLTGPLYSAQEIIRGENKCSDQMSAPEIERLADYAANLISGGKTGLFEFNTDLDIEHLASHTSTPRWAH